MSQKRSFKKTSRGFLEKVSQNTAIARTWPSSKLPAEREEERTPTGDIEKEKEGKAAIPALRRQHGRGKKTGKTHGELSPTRETPVQASKVGEAGVPTIQKKSSEKENTRVPEDKQIHSKRTCQERFDEKLSF